MFGGKDNRRSDKFNKSKTHFDSGKYQLRSKSVIEPRPPKEGSSGRRAYREIAEDTIQILESGNYEVDEQTVDISEDLSKAIQGTITYKPTDSVLELPKEQPNDTGFRVINVPTLDAILSLAEGKSRKICALNFASAKNPGGGFLNGSNAQEESLARATGLYACIKDSEMYHANNRDNNYCLYQEYMIYSPDVPVFRNSKEELLESPINVSIISVAAVNTEEALKKNVPAKIIKEIMHARTDRMLSALVNHDIDYVILGAWGCGVFGGDVNELCESLYTLLKPTKSLELNSQGFKGKYNNSFKEVVFAITDPDHFKVFNSCFNA